MSGPTNSIYVETQALYDAASAWRDKAAPGVDSARTKASNGEGQGYLFGVLLVDLQQPHNTFAEGTATALTSGKTTVAEFGEALEKVAKDFETTDSNISSLMTKKEAGL